MIQKYDIKLLQEYTHKDKGLTACEKWCRKVSETGYYKFHKVEGDINAIIAPVFGPDMKVSTKLLF